STPLPRRFPGLPLSRAGLMLGGHADLSRSDATGARRRSPAIRPYRYRHLVAVWRADAIRSRRRLPLADHQEAASSVDNRRAALVSSRRHECPLAARAKRQHLERVGG